MTLGYAIGLARRASAISCTERQEAIEVLREAIAATQAKGFKVLTADRQGYLDQLTNTS
ncbi:MAG: hypothetical protein IH820_13445 [Bacteroidetes bacterium]|nr:hypothetical protein [Bacteroidota bacterium]